MQKGFVSFARAQMVGISSTLLAAHVRPCIVVRILEHKTLGMCLRQDDTRSWVWHDEDGVAAA